ncbi:MAG TPA: hypothetical protein VGJ56_22785 [Reyranella sp.]|jgi:hypothetical protein
MKRLVLLLAFAVAACSSEAPPPVSTAERGAVHYHQVGGTALACTTWGFDTICRNP